MGNRQPLARPRRSAQVRELALARADYGIAGEMPAQLTPTSLMDLAKQDSTVRADPSTLGVVGERGSHHEGRPPARPRPPR
jgi:hypothetical protein